MVLAGIKLCVSGIFAIEHLKFGHANVGGILVATWVADGKAIVTAWWNHEFKSNDKVAVFLFSVENTALAFFALDEVINNFVVIARASPALKSFTIED